MILSYIPPEIVDGNIVVKADKEEIEEQNKKWECALIIYVIGDMSRYKFMEKYIAQAWSKVNIPDLFLHDEGYYIAKFDTIGDLKDILYGGPYTINGRLMVLKQWTPEFDIKAEVLMEIPLWVTIPNLPMSYWGNKTLSKLASAIGKPLFADECITKQIRISYARILVEANVTKKLPTEVTLQETSGKQIQLQVEYEWKPKYCINCMEIGYDCTVEKKVRKEEQYRGNQKQGKVITKWQVKGQGQQQQTDLKGEPSKAIRQENDNEDVGNNGKLQIVRDKGKAKELQDVYQREEWPTLPSNSRMTLGRTTITTANAFQILQQERKWRRLGHLTWEVESLFINDLVNLEY
ncbi:uncharacterized protein [Nicotiana sylvestris]|uniref:Uncharacterized protein LOC104217698 n=1 Tax=Nicotiana sylvestris TaxID=4096 RepID=A0A1U7VE29_NICSY|nr:PREDICTED: uncharacterized protein LOC104217698 [Nicotiana sylvestris]